jgi:hypothetical protein
VLLPQRVEVSGCARGRSGGALGGLQTTMLLGVAAGEAPGAMAFVRSAEFVALGRVIA